MVLERQKGRAEGSKSAQALAAVRGWVGPEDSR
jgi:hypothetical protein